MFWKKDSERKDVLITEVKVPQSRQPIPSSVKNVLSKETVAAYQATASAIGFSPGALLDESFKIFLKEECIPIFDFNEVETFLTREFCREPWDWIPLRKKDREAGLTNHRSHERNGLFNNNRTYQKAVPISVLETVKQVSEAFSGLCFFVSDLRENSANNEDPFLLVTAAFMGNYVIACWDEPKFEGVPK